MTTSDIISHIQDTETAYHKLPIIRPSLPTPHPPFIYRPISLYEKTGAEPGFFKGEVTAGTPSGDRRLYMVYTAALPRVSAGSVVLSRHEGPY